MASPATILEWLKQAGAYAEKREDLVGIEEDRALLMRNAIEMAAERLSDLVGDLAEDLADNYL